MAEASFIFILTHSDSYRSTIKHREPFAGSINVNADGFDATTAGITRRVPGTINVCLMDILHYNV